MEATKEDCAEEGSGKAPLLTHLPWKPPAEIAISGLGLDGNYITLEEMALVGLIQVHTLSLMFPPPVWTDKRKIIQKRKL